MATFHPTLPRGARVRTTVRGTLQEILLGPAHENDGRMNLFGALRTVDGHLRVPVGKGVPEGGGHDRPGPADRGQGPAALPGRGDGSLTDAGPPPDTALAVPDAPDTVLVVDFGAQYAQSDRPPGARGAGLLGDRPLTTLPSSELLARRPKGIILSGGPKSVYAEWAPSRRPGHLRGGGADPGHLLRGAAAHPAARGHRRADRAGRVRADARSPARGPRRCSPTGPPTGAPTCG